MTPSVECDLLIHNATLVTGTAAQPVIEAGAVAVAGGRIMAIGPEKDLLSRWRSGRTIDAGGSIVHPGLIEPHFHVVVTISRGVFTTTSP
ncbi:MAG: hypothetical protein AB7S59_25285, partial [Parvibaculaceae bacterium]